jgi:hypothetical protein
LDGGTNGVLILPSIPVEDTYQDSGAYVCIAGNGIVGRVGNIKQTGSGYVTISVCKTDSMWLYYNERYAEQTGYGHVITNGMQKRQNRAVP